MIKTVLRHYLIDAGITAFFEGIASNFATTKIKSYLGKYVLVVEDDTVICGGLVIQDEGRLMVVADDEQEVIVAKELWDIMEITKDYFGIYQDVKDMED